MAQTDYAISASKLAAAVKACGVNAVTVVPDLVQFAFHHALQQDKDIQYIECSAENQALTVAFGLYLGGKTPLVQMQNQGLLNCLNSLRSVGIDAKIPLVISVGQFGRELTNLGQSTTLSTRVCVNRMEPVLEAMQIPFFTLETPADLPKVKQAFELANEKNSAVVLLIGNYPAWS